MTTATKLIKKLNAKAKEWGDAMLIVGFPKKTRVVAHMFPERLQILEEFLGAGGVPIGFFKIELIDGGDWFEYCLLRDLEDQEWARRFIDAFIDRAVFAAPGEIFTESIGIKEFRHRK
jgi:hypothetical protein